MKINKTKLIVGIIVFFSIMLIHNNVKAVGAQADKSGTTLYKSLIELFELIRQMESSEGTLGKEAEIDTTTYLETGTGNGIDCHMIKNTEWGAAALFAYSSLGTSNLGETGKYGSGLVGMAILNNGELTASTFGTRNGEEESVSYQGLQGVDKRYRNLYTTSDAESSLPGDGLGLKPITDNGWFDYVDNSAPVYLRRNGWEDEV